MDKARGFTIVELLIVIVVIAILAAISVAAYINISDRANDSAVASDASMIAKSLEVFKVDNGGYPALPAQFPAGLKITKSAYDTTQSNVLYCLNKNTGQYAIYLVSKSGKRWVVVNGEIRANASSANPCTYIGATWANDSNNSAMHGYSTVSAAWASNWPLVQ